MGFVTGGLAHIWDLLGKGLGLRTAGRNAGVTARSPEADGPGHTSSRAREEVVGARVRGASALTRCQSSSYPKPWPAVAAEECDCGKQPITNSHGPFCSALSDPPKTNVPQTAPCL